jgi:hypothetical protein
MAGHFALGVAIALHHFACHGSQRFIGQYHAQAGIGPGQVQTQSVAVQLLETGHGSVVIHAATLSGFGCQRVEPDDAPFQQPTIRRSQLRIEQALP